MPIFQEASWRSSYDEDGSSRNDANGQKHKGTLFAQKHLVTPLKINMEPENEGLEDEFPFQTGDFQVPC